MDEPKTPELPTETATTSAGSKVPRAEFPKEPLATLHPEVERWLQIAHPLAMATLHVKLKPLDVPEGEPIQTPPMARDNPDVRRANIAAYQRVQRLRYGETLPRLRALVSINLRGDEVPMADYVIATGSAESFYYVARLAGVAEIYLPPGTPEIR